MSEPTDKQPPAEYGAEQIQILEGLEPVRMRPGMYVGGTSATGLHHCVWEIVDNAVDEALAGHCSEIVVELDADNVMSVTDNGRGIPVAKHPKTGESALDVVFTRLHAGGKFGGGGYKVSGGLHGVGASVTNALSKWLEVEVRRDGAAYQARYERGKTVQEAKEVRKLKRGEAVGTTVRWRCDDKDSFGDEGIFDRGVHYSASTIERRLKEKSFLVRGLTFRLRIHGREEQVFHSKLGIADYVRELNDGRKLVHPKVMFFSSEDAGQTGEEDIPVEVALQWTQSSDERIYSFANVISTVDHGTHVTGMRRAITRALNQFAWDANKLKKDKSESFDGRDVFDGLTAAVSVKVANPQFEGQTKGKLNNAEATGAVATFLYATFLEWMGDKANAKESKAILERCLLAREIRIKKSQVSKKLRNQATSIFADSSLPGKLADCLDNLDADEREIFIVEGDSAAGCFVGETEIRLASGEVRTLAELAADHERGISHFGYATNDRGDVRIVPLVHPRLTKRDAPLVEVMLSNGEAVRCTPDHLFRLRDGSYRRADQLSPNDSLMPLKLSLTDKSAPIGEGYELVWMNGSGRWVHTHHLADEYNLVHKLDAKSNGCTRHHVDFNKRNNDPRNILRMDKLAHLMLHAQLGSEQMKRRWADPAYRERKIEHSRAVARALWDDVDYRSRMLPIISARLETSAMSREACLEGWNRWYASMTPEETAQYRAALAQMAREYWNDPANRVLQSERVRQYFEDHPEAKAVLREKALAQWSEPGLRAWRSDLTRQQLADPSVRAEHAARVRDWWQQNPEHRERMASGRAEFLSDEKRRGQWTALRSESMKVTHRNKGVSLLNSLMTAGTQREQLRDAYEGSRHSKMISFDNLRDRYFSGDEQAMLEAAVNFNCKVVSVTPLNETADVYDLTVDRYHNFALAAGVFVHNSGKGARDNTFQAILPIRGKILNTLVARDSKAFENAEIESILIALGGRKDVIGRRIVATLEADQRRYGKVVCMSVDGDELTFIKGPDGRIRSVKIGHFIDQVLEQGEDPQQYQVLCFDQSTHRTHFKRLEAAIRHPLEETLYEIRTRYGRSVRVTSSHSVYVWENNQATLKPGHEVRPGDLIVAPHVLPLRNINAPESIDLITELAPLRQQLPQLWLRGRSVEQIYRRRADAARAASHPIDAPRVRLPQHVLRRLTLRRQQLGLTQTAVATQVGVKQAATISEWETGRGNPSIAQLNALTDALGIDADAVMAHAVLLGSQLERLRRNGAASVNQRSRQAIRFAELSEDEIGLLGPDVVLSPEKHAEAAISRRLELSPELFFLVGAYLAEGSISERCGVRFSLGSHEHGFADEVTRAASVAFGIAARRFQPRPSSQEIRLGSTAIAAVFTHVFGFAEQKSRSKQVPDWVFNVGPQLQLEFLRGYFLGDGTRLAGSNSLSVISASQQLINQLSYLLSAHGILATISAVQPQCSQFEGQTINSGPAWTLAVSGYKQMRMLERIWADDHRPHADHPIGENGPVFSRRASNTDPGERLTPEQIAELAGVGANRVRQAMLRGELAWQLPQGRKRRGRTSARGDVELWLRRRVNRSGVHQLLPGDLIGLPVVSVTPVESTGPYVYDFSVEDDENFVCGSGGICAHNTDADTDGAHICNLLLALFHELFPQLLQEGRIFVAKPPLYRINLDPRGEKYVYAYSDAEREALVKKHRRSSDDVSRFKGLGEMNAEDLAETCFDPASRQLLQVTIDDAVEAAEALKLIMGRDSSARRTWLEEVGLED